MWSRINYAFSTCYRGCSHHTFFIKCSRLWRSWRLISCKKVNFYFIVWVFRKFEMSEMGILNDKNVFVYAESLQANIGCNASFIDPRFWILFKNETVEAANISVKLLKKFWSWKATHFWLPKTPLCTPLPRLPFLSRSATLNFWFWFLLRDFLS